MTARSMSPPGEEILDDHAADPRVILESLQNIARSNRWFGGWWAVRFGLDRLVSDLPRGTSLSLLDIGTGLGDLPERASRWAARRGLQLSSLGIERHRVVARLATDAGLPTILACGGSVPIGSNGVDIVTVSQVAHHLTPHAIVDLLHECDRVARRGVIVADLVRSRLAEAGFWLGARMLAFDPVTRADGITSIRRGFSRQDMELLLDQAGVRGEVHLRPGFRIVAFWRPGAA
ncbi:MAG: methyltransferase domain-containing protein [Gemmatimonadota bacterium]